MNFYKDAHKSMAAIFSVSGCELSAKESSFFRESNPLGFILFSRNCETPEQLLALTDALKESVGRDCPILIDQEGGRVQRLRPPIWKGFPAMQFFGARAENNEAQAIEDLHQSMYQLSSELTQSGINVDCAPLMDVLCPETHDVIGDRAFGNDPQLVARMGKQVCETFLKFGIMPVIKHLPGHGRATMDSHHDLPGVDTLRSELEETDFLPFREVAKSPIGNVWGMSAHVIYEDIDPDHPASVSPIVIDDVIRGSIGFDGFLLGDDIDMKALDAYGSVTDRAIASLEAGCDAVLYCAGKLNVMEKLAESVSKLDEKALRRLQSGDELTKVSI